MEQEAKHTPAPWAAFNQRGRIYLLDAKTKNGKRTNIGDIAVDNPADARLIAAAPELLDALKRLGEAIEEGCPQRIADVWVFHAKPVIAKAEAA